MRNPLLALLCCVACADAGPETLTEVDAGVILDGAVQPEPPTPDAAQPDAPADAALPDATPPTPQPACDPTQLESAATAFEQALTNARVPGAAYAIVCQSQIALSRAFGDRGDGQPTTTRTRFQLASTTKMFTAALGVALHRSGELDVGTSAASLLPDARFGDATLHGLLSHTAAYPTEFERNLGGLQEVVRGNTQQDLWAPPDRVWIYSNPGFTVAGALIEIATGTPFSALVEQRVFAPAGMARATFDTQAILADDHATGATQGAGPITPDWGYLPTGYYQPMGGAWGTAEDLAHWAIAHMRQDAVTDPEGWALLTTPHSPTYYPGTHYGYGHFVDASDPVRVRHSGGAPGFVADVQFYPAAGFAYAVVLNADHAFPTEALDRLADQIVGARDQWSPSDSPIDAFVGTYRDPHEMGTVEVTRAGNTLTARFVDLDFTSTLEPLGDDTFLVNFQDPEGAFPFPFRFWPGEDGQPRYFASIFGVAVR